MAPNLFNSVKLNRPRTNSFDLSHDVKLSCNMGQLVPIMVQECVPGDRFQLSCSSLIRFAPMVAPVMHRMNVTMHYFFVPNRLLWDDWGEWITGNTSIAAPYMNVTTADYASDPLMDYMGLPNPKVGVDYRVNPMALAAYQCIYSEYYRDQNLQAADSHKVVSGDNTSSSKLRKLRYRAWQHDYFTAALPFAQKGPAVEIPVGTLQDAPVFFTGQLPGQLPGSFNEIAIDNSTSGAGTVTVNVVEPIGGTPSPLMADMSNVEVQATTINDLRRAMKLQEWLERNATGGTRYTESIQAHFGVRSSDARLNRPEYITGTKSPVIISEVLNTTGEVADEGLPQGNMAGHGISVTTGKYGSYFCEEHGFIIGIMSVMPEPAYQQGLHKSWTRFDKLDYYWPEFAHIGEQEVLNKEIFIPGDDPDLVFGYVPRYAEYKYTPSRVAGQFKTSLAYWHLGRIFSTQPNLTTEFIECKPDTRIFAVEGTPEDPVDHLYCQILNKVRAVRMMPRFGTPSF